MRGMGEDRARGQSRTDNADVSAESGWVTTEVDAKAVRVSPRTIRRYIERGELEYKPHGEGVRREWLVSVDSLRALRATRTGGERVPDADRGMEFADVLRDMTVRLETRAEEAAELRVRLEITERAQSTLEDERRQALQELEEERRRREAAEREREDLRRELEALRDARESLESTGATDETPTAAGGEAQEATERPQTSGEHRSWWSRIFGG